MTENRQNMTEPKKVKYDKKCTIYSRDRSKRFEKVLENEQLVCQKKKNVAPSPFVKFMRGRPCSGIFIDRLFLHLQLCLKIFHKSSPICFKFFNCIFKNDKI